MLLASTDVREVRRSAARVALLAYAAEASIGESQGQHPSQHRRRGLHHRAHLDLPLRPCEDLQSLKMPSVSPALAVTGRSLPFVTPFVPTSREGARQTGARRVERSSVLLISGHDPSSPKAPPFWFLPGGGSRKGETPEQTARREAQEELGVDLVDLGPPVWRRRAEFVFDGRRWVQQELFFAARVHGFTPAPRRLTELEKRTVTGACWWPLPLLAVTTQAIYPTRLASLLEDWLYFGPPPYPLLIT